MSTEFFNDQWRIPSNENQNKVSNYSMDFDSSNSDYIDIGTIDSLNAQQNFSISLWFKENVRKTNGFMFSSGTGTSNDIAINAANGTLKINVGGVRNVITTSYSSNVWYHVVLTVENTTAKVYLNNGSPTTVTVGSNTSSSSGTLAKIGDLSFASGYYFDGKIDQVTIFDYALSATQVSTLYGGGTAVTNPMSLSPAPVAYYQLGDQSADNGANYLVPNNSLQDYVFSFDGSNDYLDFNNSSGNIMSNKNAISISGWFKLDSNTTSAVFSNWYGGTAVQYLLRYNTVAGTGVQWYIYSNSDSTIINTNYFPNVGDWVHVVGVKDPTTSGGQSRVYINGFEYTQNSTNLSVAIANNSRSDQVGVFNSASNLMNGSISNVAYWTDTALTQAQVTEIYNQGAPSNLNTFSGNAPTTWWKLNAEDVFAYPNWIIIDSAGSNNGASVGMTSANLVQSNLQLGVGYSPYALELDGASNYFSCGSELGNSLGNAVTNFTLSGWYTAQGGASNEGLFGLSDASGNNKFSLVQSNYARRIVFFNNGAIQRSFDYDSRNQWANFVIVVSGNGSSPLTIKYYHDGTELSISSSSGTLPNSIDFSGNNAYIGNAYPLTNFFNGDVSNFSFFNFSLTSAQVTELNNNQRTANLNNLSFAKPLAWWELGSNSSFNSTTNTWTALNQGTSTGGNAISTANMTNDNIINGVGYTANGLGTSSIDIVGDAPYSTANGLSENMDVLDRVTDIPS